MMRLTGAITFKGQTTHEAGLKVTGGDSTSTISVLDNKLEMRAGNGKLSVGHEGDNGSTIVSTNLSNVSDKQNQTGFQVSVRPGAYIGNDGTATGININIPTTTDNSALSVIKAYAVTINQDNLAAEKNYGYYGRLNVNDAGSEVWQFYLEGTAPNFTAGDIWINRVSAPNLIGGNEENGGLHLSRLGTVRAYSALGGAGNNSPILAKRTDPNSQGGWIAIKTANHDASATSVIKCNGTTTRAIDARLGATGVAMADGATDIVKALQPKVITQGGETFAGFLPEDLVGTYTEAMEGTAGATVAVGTYTDPDGVVETEVEEPEVIPFGATWQQTGIQDVMQGVCRENLIPLLTKALQEALGEIDNLKERLAALEGA